MYFLIIVILVLAGCAKTEGQSSNVEITQAVDMPEETPSFEGISWELPDDPYTILPEDIERIKSLKRNIAWYAVKGKYELRDAFSNAVAQGNYHTITNIMLTVSDTPYFSYIDHFNGVCTLPIAAAHNQKELIDFFTALGYDLSDRSMGDHCEAFVYERWNAVEAAAASGHLELLEYLLGKAPLSKFPAEPLLWAVISNRWDVISYFSNKGLVLASSPEGIKALSHTLAVDPVWYNKHEPNYEAARKVLQMGVRPNDELIGAMLKRHDHQALKEFAQAGIPLKENKANPLVLRLGSTSNSQAFKESLIYLSNQGANLAARSMDGENVYFILAGASDPKKPEERINLVKWMMDQGIDIHAQAEDKQAPLSALEALQSHYFSPLETEFYFSLGANKTWTPRMSQNLIRNYITDYANPNAAKPSNCKQGLAYFEKIGVLLSPHKNFDKNFNPIEIAYFWEKEMSYGWQAEFDEYRGWQLEYTDLKEMIDFFKSKGWKYEKTNSEDGY